MKYRVIAGIMLTLLLVIFLGSSIITSVGGHAPGVMLSAWTRVPPTIDGTIDPTEWAPAATMSITIEGGIVVPGRTCTLYVMNDATNLYLALAIPDTTPDSNDHPYFLFDNDHDGVYNEEGDDALCIWGVRPVTVPPEFWDLYYDPGVPGNEFDWPPYANGTIDGSGDASNVAGINYFEFSHPLDSADDAHDFSLSVGDIVGFMIVYFDNGESLGWFPPEEYGDIIIAPPPIPGDVNGDGIVDIHDVVIAALAFGSRPGDPNWNPDADLNNDGLIDIFDLVTIGVNYGKKLPP